MTSEDRSAANFYDKDSKITAYQWMQIIPLFWQIEIIGIFLQIIGPRPITFSFIQFTQGKWALVDEHDDNLL